jgi:hypothetical protein
MAIVPGGFRLGKTRFQYFGLSAKWVFRFGTLRQKVTELDWDNGNYQIRQADILYGANIPSDLV